VFIFIPARKGSERVKGKNTKLFNGKPLIYYTLEIARELTSNSKIFISSNDLSIKEIAKKFSVNFILRPEELSGSRASTESAIFHFGDFINLDENDLILLLQPTNPLRKLETAKSFLKHGKKIIYEKNVDLVFSVNEFRDDLWISNFNRETSFKNIDLECNRLFPNNPRNQQERQPLYIENSAYYLFRFGLLIKNGRINNLISGKNASYLIDEYESIDINTELDFYYAEFVQNKILKKI
tara:strand:- start:4792 stop:5508 length:717 start_codon:yes stop_codon:yes gene_type:complete